MGLSQELIDRLKKTTRERRQVVNLSAPLSNLS
jgi:hypothetical protein